MRCVLILLEKVDDIIRQAGNIQCMVNEHAD